MDVEALVPKLTPEEEVACLSIYTSNINEICKRLKIEKRTKAVALTYFRRFFLSNSVMDVDPGIAAVTCTYLACKTEEDRRPGTDFVKLIAGLTVADLHDMEMKILEGIKCELHVFQPFRPLRGFLEDYLHKNPLEPAVQEQIVQTADEMINKSLHSDAILLFPPSQIALAAFVKALIAKGVTQERVDEYALSVLTPVNQTLEFLTKLEQYIVPGAAVPNKELKRIDDKAKAYKNHVKLIKSRPLQAPEHAANLVEPPPL